MIGAHGSGEPASAPETEHGPGALRLRPGNVILNADRSPAERRSLTVINTGDRPVQVGSHFHLADVNDALEFDRDAARGFRLDIPSGTSVRFEPGASRHVPLVALLGRRLVPGLRVRTASEATPPEHGLDSSEVRHG